MLLTFHTVLTGSKCSKTATAALSKPLQDAKYFPLWLMNPSCKHMWPHIRLTKRLFYGSEGWKVDGSARREISAIDASHVICYELHIQQ